MMNEIKVDVAVIGAGTAGLLAVREIRKAGKTFALIQDGPCGTTCARVGCMPSKALIQIAHEYHRRQHFTEQGLRGGAGLAADWPAVMRRVRALRDRFTGAMVTKTERLGDRLVRGRARFLEPSVLEVEGRVIRAGRVVLAAGSRPVVPEAWSSLGERLCTSDTFFERETLPASVAVIGLGVIGLELGQAMARLGVRVIGIARSQHLGGISDPPVLDAAADALGREFDLWRGHPPVLEAAGAGVRLTAGPHSTTVEAVLAAGGRRPNVDGIGLEDLGCALRPDGVPVHHPGTLQVGELPLFIAGDANAERPVLHEAWDDGRIAGFNAARETPVSFKRRTPLRVVFTAPQIVAAGASYAAITGEGCGDGTGSLGDARPVVGQVSFRDQGRALIRNENEGLLRLYAHPESGRLLGAEMAAPDGEHLGHLLAWIIQLDLTVHEALALPFYHPVTEEGLREALEEAAESFEAPGLLPGLEAQS